MAIFPLSVFPNQHWFGGCGFGAKREHSGIKRYHAGCDLVTKEGHDVLAVTSGIVQEARPFHISYLPQLHLFQVVIKHPMFIARYCELGRIAEGIHKGVKISEGQVIGYVGKLTHNAMLHFEMYKGDARGSLTDAKNSANYAYVPTLNYMRRSDLLDPTLYLDMWCASVSGR